MPSFNFAEGFIMFLKKVMLFLMMMQIGLSISPMETDQKRFDLYGDGQLVAVGRF